MRPLCTRFTPSSCHSFTLFTPHRNQGFRRKSRPHSRSLFLPGIFSPLPFQEPLTASGKGRNLPHEMTLMSVKVQRELAMKVKQIRSVFSQVIMHNFHSSTSEKRKRKSGEIRGKFPLSHAGEMKENQPQEVKRNCPYLKRNLHNLKRIFFFFPRL